MIIVVLSLLLNVFGTQEYTPSSAALRLVLFGGLVMLRRLLLLMSPRK